MPDDFLTDLMGEWDGEAEAPAALTPEMAKLKAVYEADYAADPNNISAPAPDAVAEQPQFPVLYHRGKGGALYQWKIWTQGTTIYTEYGITGGRKQIATKIAEPKNVGRTNATTAEQQAMTEAQAMWTHKVERKYREDINQAQETVFLPMLAHKYEPNKAKKITWPVDVQPKLDGVRCIAYWDDLGVRLMSRQGKEYPVPEHISHQLARFLPKHAIVDGELYRHGETLQTINSWVKKKRPATVKVEYHIYDVPQWNDLDDLPWRDRSMALDTLADLKTADAPNIHIVETHVARNEEEVFAFQKQFIGDGYEGAIVRTHSGIYLWGHRSDDLLKVKTFQDDEFEVVGYEVEVKAGKDSEGEFSYNCVVWKCVTPEGKPFTVRPKGTLLSRQELLAHADQYIGKKLTVRFFNYTEEGKPFLPVGIAFRLAEDLP